MNYITLVSGQLVENKIYVRNDISLTDEKIYK